MERGSSPRYHPSHGCLDLGLDPFDCWLVDLARRAPVEELLWCLFQNILVYLLACPLEAPKVGRYYIQSSLYGWLANGLVRIPDRNSQKKIHERLTGDWSLVGN